MRLTVLGNAERYLAPLARGTGYLVEAGDEAVLLDCGQGVPDAPRLAGALPKLRAVVVSHMHSDHAAGLVPVLAAATGATLVLPPGGSVAAQKLAEAFAFEGPFDHPGGAREARPGDAFRVGELRLEAFATAHSAPSLGWRIERAGRVLAYASDTGPCRGLLDLASGADALLCHTLLPTVEAGSRHGEVHTTAETAADAAEAAGARRLLLSHRHFEEPSDRFLRAARARTKAEVHLLSTGESVDV